MTAYSQRTQNLILTSGKNYMEYKYWFFVDDLLHGKMLKTTPRL